MKKETGEFERHIKRDLSPRFNITERQDGLLRWVRAEGVCRISLCFFQNAVLLHADIDGVRHNPLDVVYLRGAPYPEKKKYLDNLGRIMYEIRQVTNG